ncbi:MAG TPA: type II toxin-antitoxin system VapC family toxin [Chloroflexota bacterium]|nr:type II toxin-antitoxin system VapC family toxin [Chloroflexota bacterium]
MGEALAGRALSSYVLDANVLVANSLAADAWSHYDRHRCVSPCLAQSEALNALREAVWRGELDAAEGRAAVGRLAACPVEFRRITSLESVWGTSERLGWAKTYDAEYIALATELSCALVTLDGRLHRGAAHLVEIVSPAELG